LERRFQPVIIDPPSVEETIEILRGLRPKYEEHHRLTISEEAIDQAAKLSDRYISDRYLPDKAIDLIDEASSRVRLRASSLPPEGKEVERELRKVRRDKEMAIRNQEFEKAASLREQETKLSEKIREIQTAWKTKQESEKPVVNAEEVAYVVSSWTGIPLLKLTEGESEKLLHMSDVLHQRVIGQDEAVEAVCKAIRRARVGLKNPNRPIGSFIFSGPTGVGKTELAKALAGYFFGSEDALIRIDMSEFMEHHTTSKLIGSPPGYVGYQEGGQLTEAVRRKPYSVVLFDEIEKAHPDVFNVLLQILDDGRLSDSKGRTVDFKNTIIIMTSNVGAQFIDKSSLTVGFQQQAVDMHHVERYKKIKDLVMDAMKKTFRPEFLNRIDEIIVFQQLTRDEIRRIVDIMSADLQSRIKAQAMELVVTDDCKDLIAKEGYNPTYGARPLRRAIQRLLEDALAEQVLQGRFKEGDTIEASLDGESVKFEKSSGKKSADESSDKPEKVTTKAEKADKKRADDKSVEEATSAKN
jgi:ATP-dependent Clp protease ATP-binding subunit ClpC